ncbi:hypothetical protein [Marivita geojedonensis]|uniref:hypothetical protein n=1 Tax=Marivita geojedonensis TaxID=1123756 RepID=UPI000A1F003D|nr:hypothetical protein [Marivita geojedonensis]PRY75360.1 hypothetical protein CLV76_11550 [Marivita geojedonensis]
MGSYAGGLALGGALFGATLHAAELRDGHHRAFLLDSQGVRVEIAEIEVKSGKYAIEMKSEKFTDHFLSMRPFKCLEGPEKTWCHVPYPYMIRRDVSKDLTDLEYDLLFLWKGATEYGIDMWNGVYYRLGVSDDGRIRGTLHEMDMNILSVPPDDGNMRPIREVDLEPGDADSHWLPELVIE